MTSLKLWLRLNVDESDGSVEKKADTYTCRSYMSAHVKLNLLSELRKNDKMRGLLTILSLLRNELNKFINTRAQMLDFIYHMTLRLL